MFGQQASWDVGICALPVHGDERTATNGSREVYSTGDSGVVRVQPVRVQPAVVIDQRMYHSTSVKGHITRLSGKGMPKPQFSWQ